MILGTGKPVPFLYGDYMIMNDCKTVFSFENLVDSIRLRASKLEDNSSKSPEDKKVFRDAVDSLCESLLSNTKIAPNLQNFGIKILYMNSTNTSTMKAIRDAMSECGSILSNELVRPNVISTKL